MHLRYKLILTLIVATAVVGFIEYFFFSEYLSYGGPLTFNTLIISTLPLLGALGIGAAMSYSTSKQIQNLTMTIDDISKGKLDAHVEGKERTDEIGELARAFDRILISLKLAVEKVGIKKEELKLGEALEAKEQAERLKREAEARYRVLAQTSPDCIKLLDKNARVVFMNRTGLKEHGFKYPKDAIGWDITVSAIKEHKPKVRKAFKLALAGKPATIEVQHSTSHAYEWTLETFSPVANDKGDVVNVLAVSRNITKLKHSEAELRSERDFIEDLIEHAGVPVVAFDKNGKLLIANKLFLHMTGYEKSDISTRDRWFKASFPTKETHVKMSKAIGDFYRGKDIKDFVIPLRCKDGTSAIVVGNLTCIKDENSKTIGDVMFMRDLSEIFTLEEEIKYWATNGFIQPQEKSSVPSGIEQTDQVIKTRSRQA